MADIQKQNKTLLIVGLFIVSMVIFTYGGYLLIENNNSDFSIRSNTAKENELFETIQQMKDMKCSNSEDSGINCQINLIKYRADSLTNLLNFYGENGVNVINNVLSGFIKDDIKINKQGDKSIVMGILQLIKNYQDFKSFGMENASSKRLNENNVNLIKTELGRHENYLMSLISDVHKDNGNQ